MKRLIVVLLAVCSLFLYACGSSGGGGDDGSSGNAPEISGLSYYPDSANQNDGGGAVTLNAYIDFFDKDGDITELTTIYVFNGVETVEPLSLTDMAGETSGTLYLKGSVPTTEKGTYNARIYVKDATNLKSNELTAIFTVN